MGARDFVSSIGLLFVSGRCVGCSVPHLHRSPLASVRESWPRLRASKLVCHHCRHVTGGRLEVCPAITTSRSINTPQTVQHSLSPFFTSSTGVYKPLPLYDHRSHRTEVRTRPAVHFFFCFRGPRSSSRLAWSAAHAEMAAGTAVARGSSSRQSRQTATGRRAGSRADRDGDVSMDSPALGRGRIGKKTAGAAGRPSRDGAGRATRGGGILSANAQRHILRHAANGEVGSKSVRSGGRSGLVELKVTGWEKSTSSANKDRGVSALTGWLEKKASRKLGPSSGRREVRIRKVSRRTHRLTHIKPLNAISVIDMFVVTC